MTKAEREQKKQEKLLAEQQRVAGMRAFERDAVLGQFGTGFFPELLSEGSESAHSDHPEGWDTILICGIDEAGRGPLAGPVAAGAVILRPDHDILYLNDSKKLSAAKRDMLFDVIKEEALAWQVSLVWQERIDEINILQATYEAMRSAVAGLPVQPSVLLNDAVTIPMLNIPQVPIVKGDAKCLSIAAASILAKVTRDRLMEEMDQKYPEYGFAKHKGYGTKEHIEAIRKYGPCPIHRRTFIQNFI